MSSYFFAEKPPPNQSATRSRTSAPSAPSSSSSSSSSSASSSSLSASHAPPAATHSPPSVGAPSARRAPTATPASARSNSARVQDIINRLSEAPPPPQLHPSEYRASQALPSSPLAFPEAAPSTLSHNSGIPHRSATTTSVSGGGDRVPSSTRFSSAARLSNSTASSTSTVSSRSSSTSSAAVRAETTLPPISSDGNLLSDVIAAVSQNLQSRPWMVAAAPIIVHVALRLSGVPGGAIGPIARIVGGLVASDKSSSTSRDTSSLDGPQIPSSKQLLKRPTKSMSPQGGKGAPSQPVKQPSKAPSKPRPSSLHHPAPPPPARPAAAPKSVPLRPNLLTWVLSAIYGPTAGDTRAESSSKNPLDSAMDTAKRELQRQATRTLYSLLFRLTIVVAATALVVRWRSRSIRNAGRTNDADFNGRPPGFRARSTLPSLVSSATREEPLPDYPAASGFTVVSSDRFGRNGNQSRDSKFDPVVLAEKLETLSASDGSPDLRTPPPKDPPSGETSESASHPSSPVPQLSPKPVKLRLDTGSVGRATGRIKSREAINLYTFAATPSGELKQSEPVILRRQTSLANLDPDSNRNSASRRDQSPKLQPSTLAASQTASPTEKEPATSIPQHKSHAQPIRPPAALPALPQTESDEFSQNAVVLDQSTSSKRSLSFASKMYRSVNKGIAMHRQLTVLWLNGNSLTSIPDELFVNCPNLVFLDLSDNKLAPHLPVSICNCSKLKELYVKGNALTEVEPRHVSGSPRPWFDPSIASFTGLRSLTRLEVLDLRGNHLTHLPHDLFTTLRNLRALFLSNNPLRILPPTLGLLGWRNPDATTSDQLLAKQNPSHERSPAESDLQTFTGVGGSLTWLDLEGCGRLESSLLRYIVDPLIAANGLVRQRIQEHFAERKRSGGGWMAAEFSASTMQRRGSRSVASGGAPSAIEVLYLGSPPPAGERATEEGDLESSDAEPEDDDDDDNLPLSMFANKAAQWLDRVVVDASTDTLGPLEKLRVGSGSSGGPLLDSPNLLKKRKSNPESRSPMVQEFPSGYFTIRRNSNDSIASVSTPASPLIPSESFPWSQSVPAPPGPGTGISIPASTPFVPLSQLHPGFLHLQRLLSYLRDVHDLDHRTVIDSRNRRSASLMALRKSSSMPESGIASGDDPDAPGLTDTEREKIRKRQSPARRANIAAEILSTERTYVKELQALEDIYVSALEPGGSAKDILSANDVSLLFSNVKDLLSLHKRSLLPAIEDALRHPNQPLGAVFVDAAERLKEYSVYYNNFDNANAFVAQFEQVLQSTSAFRAVTSTMLPPHLLQSSSLSPNLSASSRRGTARKLRNFLKTAKSHPAHSQISLQSYLILPVQRLPRYKLLIDQLLEATPINHPDRADLANAAQLIRACVAECNDLKREQEQRDRAIEVMKRIGPRHMPSIGVESGALEHRFYNRDPSRRFVREGTLRVVKLVERDATFFSVFGPNQTGGHQRQTPHAEVSLAVPPGRRGRVFSTQLAGLVETRMEMDWQQPSQPPVGVLDMASQSGTAKAMSASHFLFTRHASTSLEMLQQGSGSAVAGTLLAGSHASLMPPSKMAGASTPSSFSGVSTPMVVDPLAVHGLQLTTGRDLRIFLFSDVLCLCAETPVPGTTATADGTAASDQTVHFLIRTLAVGLGPRGKTAAGFTSFGPHGSSPVPSQSSLLSLKGAPAPLLSFDLLPLPSSSALGPGGSVSLPLPPLPQPQQQQQPQQHPSALQQALQQHTPQRTKSPWAGLTRTSSGIGSVFASSPLSSSSMSPSVSSAVLSSSPSPSSSVASLSTLTGPPSASPANPGHGGAPGSTSTLLFSSIRLGSSSSSGTGGGAAAPATPAALAAAAAGGGGAGGGGGGGGGGAEGILRLADGDTVVYLRGALEDLEAWVAALDGLQKEA